jgi:aromatic-L-amino-acid decarboxylase
MKLWWLIRSAGVSGLQKRLRRDLDNAQWLAQRIEEAPHWRLLAPVSLQTVCVVHEPPHIEPGGATDEYTQRWCEAINASGVAMLTPAQITDHRGQECWMVRVSIGALGTEREHIEKLWGHMQRHTAA